ncbi:uncharacterized protein VTP21DRAFT_1035 [Calcarisporiella thermophila]|uniref:uncharacterized protein n=1 Tax=Calcarisporiella thermophila TaxID=911321 RepID=UPI00374444F6
MVENQSSDTAASWQNAIHSLKSHGSVGLERIHKAWDFLTTYLSQENLKKLWQDRGIQNALSENFSILRDSNFDTRLFEWYIASAQSHITSNIGLHLIAWTNDFEKLRERGEVNIDNWVCKTFESIFAEIHEHYSLCLQVLTLLEASALVTNKFIRQYQSWLYSYLPSAFQTLVSIYYRHQFQCFSRFTRLISTKLASDTYTTTSILAHRSRWLPRPISTNGTTLMDIFVAPREESRHLSEPQSLENEAGDNIMLSHEEQGEVSEEEDAEEREEEEEEEEDEGAIQKTLDQLSADLSRFTHLCKQMDALGLLYRTEGILIEILHGKIEDKIQRSFRGCFDKPLLKRSNRWLDQVILRWLALIICPEGVENSPADKINALKEWKTRLEYHLNKAFGDLRISELFDIIVEFPDSQPAIDDLKECLSKTDQKRQLMESLRNAFERRLLQPGANTSDILTQYISTIRCLRILDPSGVMLEYVAVPVRRYLQTRDDAIRCIVTTLVDDNNQSLLLGGDEEGNMPAIALAAQSDDEDEDFDDDEWTPDPIDAGPEYKSIRARAADIVAMLISIYDSRDLFVHEFQTLMADRLLSSHNYEIDREVRHLELLKLRFGESKMQPCEVMIKDIGDSKRIDGYVHADQEFPTEAPLHAMVLSRLFWPNFRSEELQLPSSIQRWMDAYANSFQRLKAARKIAWLNHLGTVELELELEDRTLDFRVSPAHAALIYLFQERKVWTAEELAGQLGTTAANARRRAGFWVGQGVLAEKGGGYVVLERRGKPRRGNRIRRRSSLTFSSTAEEEEEDPDYSEWEDSEEEDGGGVKVKSPEEQEAEAMQGYWTYITGLLTNLGPQPLERIQTMLTMFCQPPARYNKTADELRRYLELMVREEKLEVTGGLYKLRR